MGRTKEASIITALEKLDGDLVRTRTEGLEDLKRILGPGRGSSRVDELSDNAFHKILEVLFRIIRAEKQNYLQHAKPTSASSRMTTAAAALRLLVETATPKLKYKTAAAILDHIIDTLPLAEGGYCAPLEVDYLKAFRTALEHPSHVEHLKAKQWQAYVDFATEGISNALDNESDDPSQAYLRQTSMTSRNSVNVSIRVSQTSNARGSQPSLGNNADNLLGALSCLTNSPNAPLRTRLSEVVEVMIHWVQNMSRAQETAFECINHLLPLAVNENVTLASSFFQRLAFVITQLWSNKSTALKDQMLITLLHLKCLYLNVSWEPPLVDAELLDSLIASMWDENEKRGERGLLQIDDLSFTPAGNPPPLSLKNVRPASDEARVTTAWATLYLLACLIVGLSQKRRKTDESEENEIGRKRRRLENSIEEIFQRAIHSSGPARVVALQLCLFTIDRLNEVTSETLESVQRLEACLSDDDPVINSWTFIIFARCTQSSNPMSSLSEAFWPRIWMVASRNLSNSSSSRSACHLMDHIMQNESIRSSLGAQLISDSFFSEGRNGPGSFTDAGILVLTQALTCGALDSEKSFRHFASRSLGWLDSHWTIRAIYQAAYIDDQDLQFAKFMLDDHSTTSNSLNAHQGSLSYRFPKQAYLSANSVSDLLVSKARSFSAAWDTLTRERASHVNADIVEIAATLCILASLDLCQVDTPEQVVGQEGKDFNNLWQKVCHLCSQRTGDGFHSLVSKLTRRLLQIRGTEKAFDDRLMLARSNLLATLMTDLSTPSETQDTTSLDIDASESFDTRTSQASQMRIGGTKVESGRRNLPYHFDLQTSFIQSRLLLRFNMVYVQNKAVLDADVMAQLVNIILELKPDELFRCRFTIMQLLGDDFAIRRNDACRLVERFGEVCLRDKDLERCEAALCLCLQLMTCTSHLWASDDGDGLGDSAYDIYDWYVNIALGKGLASTQVLLSLSALLEALLRTSPSYSSGELPSPRTTLLQILSIGPASVKFSIAPQLSHLFDGYILSEHTVIFNDIVESLPSDPDNREGIRVRLYVLAYLGARWHTILRQAVYHIFETAANVPSVDQFARKCVKMMCAQLKLKSSKHLFRLFSPQILYTWLEKESIETIPFNAFGYRSLPDMLQDVQDELVAQIVMRNSPEHVRHVVQFLGVSWDSLVERCFPRVITYAIIADISIHRSNKEIGKAESSVLELLGEARYGTLLHSHFPEALGILMQHLIDDRGFDKAFGGDADDSGVVSTFSKICQYSASTIVLPPGQQPSFRAKYLLHMLNKLSSHARVSLEQLWTFPVLASLYRSLLDDAKPAFGPLHACAVLRKIRAVISLAGHAALSRWPLEMLLHNLRPFLTEFHCSQDAFGIAWYLLERGKKYLTSRLPFITGLAVTIFASLSRFVTSSQDSTTQESHFALTISKAHEFRKWLGEYLFDMDTSSLTERRANTFDQIVKSARNISVTGNSNKSTSEGSLLFYLIMDQASSEPLLSQTSFFSSVQILCREFIIFSDPAEDLLADNDNLMDAVPTLWVILRNGDLHSQLRTWTAQTLGRACAIFGPDTITSLAQKQPRSSHIGQSNASTENSYSSIIAELFDQAWTNERATASISEQTLQQIFSIIPRSDRRRVIGNDMNDSVFDDLRFEGFNSPRLPHLLDLDEAPRAGYRDMSCDMWAANLGTELCQRSGDDPVLSALQYTLYNEHSVASRMLPRIVHLVLSFELDKQQTIRAHLSTIFTEILQDDDATFNDHATLIIHIINYLRRCTMPSETAMSNRDLWLDIDFSIVAAAACRCGLFHDALLMLEISSSNQAAPGGRSKRRSSSQQNKTTFPQELLSKIYRSIDDPDFFYGIDQEPDITSLVDRLCHEGAGQKALSFQSALFDSTVRLHGSNTASHTSGSATVSALNLASFHGLANVVHQSSYLQSATSSLALTAQSSMNLHQWNVGRDGSQKDESMAAAKVFRALDSTSNVRITLDAADDCILQLAHSLATRSSNRFDHVRRSTSLAVLSELKEILHRKGFDELEALMKVRMDGMAWTEQTSFDNVEPILLGREVLFATIRNSAQLQSTLSLTPQQAFLLEARALRTSLATGQGHEMSQFCLNRAVYMSALIPSATSLGLKIDAVIQYDLANTLWTHDETSASIKILQGLRSRSDLKDQDMCISHSEVLTDLGQKLTKARLDRPDEVTSQYLQPAIESLGDNDRGPRAGRVYHNFAAFCDQQLRDPDNLEEFVRLEKLRNKKKQEVEELEAMKKTKEGRERDQIRGHLVKAQTWFKLDEQEWRRLKKHREDLISDCLENYLRAMTACENFPNDVLRFLALWLDQSQNEEANATVAKYVPDVPSHKFAPLMNQLSSRILDSSDAFQRLLFDLMFRICNDHPYHALYQVFATSKSKGQKNDTVATSRHQAATKLAGTVMKKGAASAIWVAIHNSNIAFVRVAQDRLPDREGRAGSKLLLRKLPQGSKLEQTIHDLHQKIPPPTMNIGLRPDGDYSSIPSLAKFDPSITIAGGVSAPKIVTAIASDGSRHKMLLKGGNDDLRQDSIMEQVFEQVSNLLKDHRATRQRNLGIRTYKVIPLTHNAGIIEFVRDTMPLHDYVLPAHARHFPRDYKASRCRKEIADAQTKSPSQRLQVYRNVTANFHPVMRFFFMEHFLEPDEWFEKRLNYSRSTAAISILGYVLGLGDRHGHNILLDTKTGEVVHVDLGVAFEAGRVLPVPEVVPFRLTRDLVDGMGISGVEGVFRRCCNFTLEALRQDQEAIMTILDVLRWDPLYSWSASPLRLQRMQENQEQAANATTNTSRSASVKDENDASTTTSHMLVNPSTIGAAAKNHDINEPGEADRALAVVAKKLGKGLSVEATVNDLIRQATDERNLAVLYCGWAAYA